MDELDLQTPSNKIQRSYEFLLVAYFLARFGVNQEPGTFPEPPLVIGAGTWNAAYDFFYDAVSDGRTPTTFRKSLKNARDSFDSHLGVSGRVGWRNTDTKRTPATLSNRAIEVLNEFKNKNEFEITSLIMKLVRGGGDNMDRDSSLQKFQQNLELTHPIEKGEEGVVVAVKYPL